MATGSGSVVDREYCTSGTRIGMMSDLKFKFRHVVCVTCANRTFQDKTPSDLQRVDRESLALPRALVGQLDKLNDRDGLLPFNG